MKISTKVLLGISLIFLWKAHMAGVIVTPHLNTVNLFSNLKNIFFFVSKALKFYTEYENNDLIMISY